LLVDEELCTTFLEIDMENPELEALAPASPA